MQYYFNVVLSNIFFHTNYT